VNQKQQQKIESKKEQNLNTPKDERKSDVKATKPINHISNKKYREEIPSNSKTFRERIAVDKKTHVVTQSHKVNSVQSDMDSSYRIKTRGEDLRNVDQISYYTSVPNQPGPFKKCQTNVNNYINIQNELESNWNFKTKSEMIRPSYATSIDPDKMNIRGYLQQNRISERPPSERPVMDIVNRLLESKIITTLIQIKQPPKDNKPIKNINTISFHLRNIYRKLGVNSRVRAIQRARELGLL